jgi:hypothetical protein
MSKHGESTTTLTTRFSTALAICLLAAALPTYAHAQCPNYHGTSRAIGEVLVNGTAQAIKLSGSRVEVTFTLQSQHAFNPPDPTGCDSRDGIALETTSVNVSGFQTISQNSSTAVVELTPQNLRVNQMALDFTLRFQQDFNITGNLNFKRKVHCELIIPWASMQFDSPQDIAVNNCS